MWPLLQEEYILDSFTELIPGHSKRSSDHYLVYKCVNQVWLRYDNEMVKKANLSGNFWINLAFFRHVHTSTAVNYEIDFAVIKQGRARRSVSFAAGTNIDLPQKLAKRSGTDSEQKSLLCKSSAIPSTSAGTSQSVEDVSSLIPVESEGADSITTPSVIENQSTVKGVTSVSDAAGTEDFDIEQTSGIESTENVSDNAQSDLVITNVRSVSEMSSSEVPETSQSGGQSAEDLPSLELNKCLHVTIECYPNLLKHFDEGKVRIKKPHPQDVRLTAIKTKKVTSEVFEKFYLDITSREQPGISVASYVPVKFPIKSESSSSSSEEGDDTKDDEDYVPDTFDLGGDPDGVEVKKTKAEGTYMSNICTKMFKDKYFVSMLASSPFSS